MASPLSSADAAVVGEAQGDASSGATISIKRSKSSIPPGGTAWLKGVLDVPTGSASDQPLALEGKPLGSKSFKPLGLALTGSQQVARMSVTPDVSSRYRWRYIGGGSGTGSTSAAVTVLVAKATASSPTKVATTLTASPPRSPAPGMRSPRVSGMLSTSNGGLPNRSVVLLQREDGMTRWSYAQTAKTGDSGRVTFQVGPVIGTRYRLIFAGTSKLTSRMSAMVELPSQTSTISITRTDWRVPKGARVTIRGLAKVEGEPAAAHEIDLLAAPAYGDAAYAVLATSATGDDGSVSFEVTPERDMLYRLRIRTMPRPSVGFSDPVLIRVR